MSNSKIQPSIEQQNFINLVLEGNNVMVDAVAGAGKTTAVFALADQYHHTNKRIVVVTYNAELKDEMIVRRNKMQTCMSLDNLEIFNYHTLAGVYGKSAKNDAEIWDIIKQNLPFSQQVHEIGILALDEVQDMVPLYFQFIQKFLRDLPTMPQIVVLGDVKQILYTFKGADSRFLSLAPQLYNIPFKTASFTTSYRITRQICAFLNRHVLHDKRMVAVKDGTKVHYHAYQSKRNNSIYTSAKEIIYWIEKYLNMGDSPDDIFVLSHSIKSTTQNNPIIIVENKLVDAGYKCYVPKSDIEQLNSDVMRGKITFSTFHQAKGRERKRVFILNFDTILAESLYSMDGWLPTIVHPTLYVAPTRSSMSLHLFDNEGKPPAFMRDITLAESKKFNVDLEKHNSNPAIVTSYKHFVERSKSYVEFHGHPSPIWFGAPENENPNKKTYTATTTEPSCMNTSVTKLITYLPTDLEIEIHEQMEFLFEVTVPPDNTIEKTCGKLPNDDGCEVVSDLIGMLIPALIESKFNKDDNYILREMQEQYEVVNDEKHSNIHDIYHTFVRNLRFGTSKLSDFIQIVIAYSAFRDKFHYRLRQITNYDFIDEIVVQNYIEKMESILNVDCDVEMLDFERQIVEKDDGGSEYTKLDEFTQSLGIERKQRISGCIDAVTGEAFSNTTSEEFAYEFKCVSELTCEHQLQTMVYAWLIRMLYDNDNYTFRLINIYTGEVQTLLYDETIINNLMGKILKANETRKGGRNVQTDEEFLAANAIVN